MEFGNELALWKKAQRVATIEIIELLVAPIKYKNGGPWDGTAKK